MVYVAIWAIDVDSWCLLRLRTGSKITKDNSDSLLQHCIAPQSSGSQEAEESTTQSGCKEPKPIRDAILVPVLNGIFNNIVNDITCSNGGSGIQITIEWHVVQHPCSRGPPM